MLSLYDPIAKAFNDGCDARYAGWPRDANQYHKSGNLKDSWDAGWCDMHNWWGVKTKGRWPVRPPRRVDVFWAARMRGAIA